MRENYREASPVIANIYMRALEERALSTFELKPKVWYRYVDDVFSITKKTHVPKLLQHLNNQHPSIRFTEESEKGGKLPFLEVNISRTEDRHVHLRGAWRDHRFPEPFSWFLHETGLDSLKITSARFFFIEMSKESLEKSERKPAVSWRPWALAYSRDRPYNFSCLSAVSKNRRFRSFFRLWGVIWRGKAFRDQQCQFLTRNKSLSSENESNCSMTSECVRTDSILPRGAGLEHGRCKQSIFSLSIFGTLVERLSF